MRIDFGNSDNHGFQFDIVMLGQARDALPYSGFNIWKPSLGFSIRFRPNFDSTVGIDMIWLNDVIEAAPKGIASELMDSTTP